MDIPTQDHSGKIQLPQKICAVVLAAGQSKRMGQPKLVLPWGNTTVIAHIIATLFESGISDIYIVVGGAGELVRTALSKYTVHYVENPNYKESEMLASLQLGIQNIGSAYEALFVVLGDQPTIDKNVIDKLVEEYRSYRSCLVIPSYKHRRGHPWLVHHSLWQEIVNMDRAQTLRDFLNIHSQEIHYALLEDPGILYDLDTPEDYQKFRPGQSKI